MLATRLHTSPNYWKSRLPRSRNLEMTKRSVSTAFYETSTTRSVFISLSLSQSMACAWKLKLATSSKECMYVCMCVCTVEDELELEELGEGADVGDEELHEVGVGDLHVGEVEREGVDLAEVHDAQEEGRRADVGALVVELHLPQVAAQSPPCRPHVLQGTVDHREPELRDLLQLLDVLQHFLVVRIVHHDVLEANIQTVQVQELLEPHKLLLEI